MAPSLLHALVAADTTVLAEAHGPSISHDPEQGSQFSQATSTILKKIPPNNSKLSYQLEDYLCHYIRQDGERAGALTAFASGWPRPTHKLKLARPGRCRTYRLAANETAAHRRDRDGHGGPGLPPSDRIWLPERATEAGELTSGLTGA